MAGKPCVFSAAHAPQTGKYQNRKNCFPTKISLYHRLSKSNTLNLSIKIFVNNIFLKIESNEKFRAGQITLRIAVHCYAIKRLQTHKIYITDNDCFLEQKPLWFVAK